MCVLFFESYVSVSAYANVYFKTTIIKQNTKMILIAGVPSSQVLLGYLITAPPSVCVPAVIGVLTVWIPKYICIYIFGFQNIYVYIFISPSLCHTHTPTLICIILFINFEFMRALCNISKF